ncbi:nucleoside recognition protein [Christensenellaceae bacterium NSJ-63]|uniref:Nucleoside recognition protein n=1 Tax=Guopingia tenuis TaxID=2763656 RepID=A0A926DLE4_9FIRM|nr:nucleoside recognition domain-containing protein [Guopingia tenuis]MBC8539250.1 nucleoside recognition protein [Guopingia tenuis]
MIKVIWGGLILVGIAVGIGTGRVEELSQTILGSAKDAAELALSMIGIYCLWMGLLRIAEKSGMIQAIARGSERLICKLFTGIRRGSEAVSLITLNLVANMLGMGNAATPFGLRAMAALQEQNPDKRRASDDMCLFIVINTASVQLLPLTIIAVRAAAGSSNPADIVLTAFLATLATAVFGVIGAKLCAGIGRRKT